MNAVMEKLPALVEEELEAANSMHTVFHSMHEGYAVLLEEVEEAHAEQLEAEFQLLQLWKAIKTDNARAAQNWARDVERSAIRLAAEAIQVAAMARKFQAIGEGWTPND